MKKFDSAEAHIVPRNFDWYDDRVVAIAVNQDIHKVYIERDQVLADIPVEARIGISEPLTNKRVTAKGTMLYDEIEFRADGNGEIVPGDRLVVFKDTGNEKTSFLIATGILTKEMISDA